MPIEIGPNRPAPARAIGAVDPWAARAARPDDAKNSGVARHVGPADKTVSLDPGEAPVDAERVAQIRKAIETGRYPVVPARIADAMIAAGLLLRHGK